MARRLRSYALIGLGALSLAIACVLFFRNALVETLIIGELKARGIPAPQLSVREVGARRIRIENLRVGARGELAARALVVDYSLSAIMRGRMDTLAIDGLRLHLDATGERPMLGSLQPLLDGAGDGSAIPIPSVVLSAVEVSVATRHGPVAAKVVGELVAQASGAITAKLNYNVEGDSGSVSGTIDGRREKDGDLSGDVRIQNGFLALAGAELSGLRAKANFALSEARPPRLDAELTFASVALSEARFEKARVKVEAKADTVVAAIDLGSADGRWSIAGRATVEDYQASGRTNVTLQAMAGAEADLFAMLGLPRPDKGEVSARFFASGSLGPLLEKGNEVAISMERLKEATLSGEISVVGNGLSFAQRAEDVFGQLELDGRLEDGVLELVLARDARLETSRLDESWLRELGFPELAADLLGDGASVSLAAGDQAPGRLQITLDANLGEFTTEGLIRLAVPKRVTGLVSARAHGTLGSRLRLSALALNDILVAASGLDLPMGRLSSLEISGSLAGHPESLAGPLDVSLDLGAFEAGELRARRTILHLPVVARFEPGSARLELRAPGRFEAEAIEYADRARSEALLRADIQSAELRIEHANDTLLAEHEIVLDAKTLPLSVLRSGAPPVAIEVTAGRVRVLGELEPSSPYQPRLKIDNARVNLPQYGINAERISALLDLGAPESSPLVEFDIYAFERSLGGFDRAPVNLRGSVYRQAKEFKISATGHAVDGTALLNLHGRHQHTDRRGQLTLDLGPLRFAPDALQPGSLRPELRDLRSVSGEVAGTTTITWGPGEIHGSASLSWRDLAFEVDRTAVRDLSLELRLDQLFPPASPAGQRLTVRRIDAGVPLEDVEIRFQIPGDKQPQIAIELAEMHVSGGHFYLRDTLFDPQASSQEFSLNVRDLDLARFFSAIAIEGVTGHGQLSGAFPMRVSADAVVVEDGHLTATGPGVLRIRSERAAQILAGAGEQVDLLLRALQDFHYEELTLTLNKPADDEFQVTLSTLGNNPAVLDGHPFRLNINLQGRANELFLLFTKLYGLSNRLLRRAWMFDR